MAAEISLIMQKKKTFKFTDLKNLKEPGGEQRTKKMSEKEEKKKQDWK